MSDYVTLPTAVMQNKELSLKAKGLYAFMLSLPPKQHTPIPELAEMLKEGKTAIYNAINELKSEGLCRIEVSRNREGKIIGNEYHFVRNL